MCFLDGVSRRERRAAGRKRVQRLVAYGVWRDGTRPAPLPTFFITFFSYAHHRLAPQSVRRYLDRTPSIGGVPTQILNSYPQVAYIVKRGDGFSVPPW